MAAMNRISNLAFVLLGALSVGVVVAVLALSGALPDRVGASRVPERHRARDDHGPGQHRPPPPNPR